MTSKMAGLVKVPDSKTDWQAIDIYVFSNGQQYSPPRKYHLRSEDLNWWKSTLNFLARTQYGTLHSYIDLYTTDGKKIVSPLELSNGAPYVAVAPHDRFVDAGYDKYLIRASRSWEKRQAKKTSVAETDKSTNQTAADDTIDESTDLKTIVPSVMDHDTSIIVQPQPPSSAEQKTEPLHVLPAKLSDRKRPSAQRSSISRRITPPTPVVPNMKTAFKKKESIKTANVKITKPESERNSVLNANSKLTAKSKIYKPPRSREASVQPETIKLKNNEAEDELKSSSLVKTTTTNVTIITNDNVDTNIIEEKETVANIYENPRSNMPSVAVDPNLIQYFKLIEENLATPNSEKNERTSAQKDVENVNEEIIIKAIQNSENIDAHPLKYSIKVDKNLDDHYTTYDVSYNVKETTNTNNGTVDVSSTENKENVKHNNPISRKFSVKNDKVIDEQLSTQVVISNVDKGINIINGGKLITPVSTPQKHSTMPNKITDEQLSTQVVISNVDQSTNINNEEKIITPANTPRKLSNMPNKPTNERFSTQIAHNYEQNTNLSHDHVINMPRKISIMPNITTDDRLSVQIANIVEQSTNLNNDFRTPISTLPKPSISPAKNADERLSVPVAKDIEQNTNVNYKVRTSTPASTPKKSLIVPDNNTSEHFSVQVGGNIEPYINMKTNTCLSNENIKTRNSLTTKRPSLGTKLSSSQYATHNIIHVEENIDLNNEVATNSGEMIINNNIAPAPFSGHDRPLDDRYVTVLNKGDVVNLKLNIEIQNIDGNFIKLSDNANLHPVTNAQRTEKGSQINITNQMVVQTNSLLSMIAKEINDRHIGDNHLFIVVQCSGCKYCNDQNASVPDVNKNYMILLPVKKYEDNILRCYCGDQNRNSSVVNPLKATFSCMSVQRLTKLNQMESMETETVSQVISSAEAKTDDNVLQDTNVSDNNILTVAKKKSVAIHMGCTPISHECSKMSHQVNIKTESVTVSKEFIEVLRNQGIDNSTQTEWCDVLLEARQLDDGHYSFRLPSLEILKFYKLT